MYSGVVELIMRDVFFKYRLYPQTLHRDPIDIIHEISAFFIIFFDLFFCKKVSC